MIVALPVWNPNCGAIRSSYVTEIVHPGDAVTFEKVVNTLVVSKGDSVGWNSNVCECATGVLSVLVSPSRTRWPESIATCRSNAEMQRVGGGEVGGGGNGGG